MKGKSGVDWNEVKGKREGRKKWMPFFPIEDTAFNRRDFNLKPFLLHFLLKTGCSWYPHCKGLLATFLATAVLLQSYFAWISQSGYPQATKKHKACSFMSWLNYRSSHCQNYLKSQKFSALPINVLYIICLIFTPETIAKLIYFF